MKVSTVVEQDISAKDMARGLIAAGPDMFAEFFLALYTECEKQKVDLDLIAQRMAEEWGAGRKVIWRKLHAKVTYFEEHSRRADSKVDTHEVD